MSPQKISVYLKCESTFVILCILVSYWYQTYNLRFMKVYKYFVFNNEIFWSPTKNKGVTCYVYSDRRSNKKKALKTHSLVLTLISTTLSCCGGIDHLRPFKVFFPLLYNLLRVQPCTRVSCSRLAHFAVVVLCYRKPKCVGRGVSGFAQGNGVQTLLCILHCVVLSHRCIRYNKTLSGLTLRFYMKKNKMCLPQIV